MNYIIKSLNDQGIRAVNFGLIDFEEIKMKSDSNTRFEFDDTKPSEITFIQVDANGKVFPKQIDLSEFGLNYNYVLDKIRPVFDSK